MASKYQIITAAYNNELLDSTESPDKWQSLLKTAANNYKYSFPDQVLIYAQRPHATACADINVWNTRFDRWVNKGTHGIALVDNRFEKPRLRYVFDVSDTNSRRNEEVYLWSVNERYYDNITEGLESTFGDLSDKSSFPDSIKSTAKNLSEDNFSDYLRDLIEQKEDSFLEELDEDSISVLFRDLVSSSVAYMMMSRCGLDADSYFTFEDFNQLYNFNTRGVIEVLGTASSDIAEMGLREIESTVRNIHSLEKNINRTFDKSQTSMYDVDVSKTTETERSDNDETGDYLHEEGRLSDSRPDTASDEGLSAAGQVRASEEILSDGAQESTIYTSGDGERASGASVSDKSAGFRDDGIDSESNGEGAGSDGTAQGGRSDEVGSDDEQYPQFSGRDRSERVDLQLSHHNWNKGGGIPYYYAPDEKNELIRTCEKLKDNRVEIATFFAENSSRDERGNFIKQYFDNTYIEQILESGQRAGYRAYDDCLHVWRGSFASREKEDYMKWWSVADHIYGMILLDTWLEPEDRFLASEFEQIQSIDNRIAEKGENLSLPQAAVDYVISRNGKDFKCQVFELCNEDISTEDLAKVLKDHHGIGGSSDAIPGSGYSESHDGKGIQIHRSWKGQPGYASVTISWNKAAKRITELIKADRYLTAEEKEYYPVYVREKELRQERQKIADEYTSIIRDYNDFQDSLGNNASKLNSYDYISASNRFVWGEKKDYIFAINENVFVLPKMREAMNKIIAENTHLTERCQNVLNLLSGDIAKPFEPTFDELNPPPEPEKVYDFSLGDTVHIGIKAYDILSLGEDEVSLFDSEFPIINKVMSRSEFDKKIKENPLNDKFLKLAEKEKGEPELVSESLLGNTVDHIYLDKSTETITWLYLNPDATAGAQYVSNSMSFRTFMEFCSDYQINLESDDKAEQAKTLRNYIDEAADQVLADVNTIYFAEADNEYNTTPDYTDFTPENFVSIYKEIESYIGEIEPMQPISIYDSYNQEQSENPEATLLYQVGDFYEAMGENAPKVAESLDLVLGQRTVNDVERIPMVGMPSNRLETYMNMLLDRGFDVAISTAEEDGSRKNVLLSSGNKEEPVNSFPVGRIDYLSSDGKVKESIEYTSEYQFVKDIKDELYYGVPINLVFYRDGNGNTISRDFLDSLDTMPAGSEIIDSPYIKTDSEPVDITAEVESIADAIYKTEKDNEVAPELTLSAPKTVKHHKMSPTVLHPEVTEAQRNQFSIPMDLYQGEGKKQRFRNNIEAINTLHNIEFENRLATPEEQKILAKYVGWGGLSEAFDENNSSWADEFKELYVTLSPEEYEAARESSLTAFYTPPEVINAMYEALGNMGFKNGNILEPSCGIGNFIGMIPDNMNESKVYGVELDSVSGRIAQQLYQKSSIAVQGFEETALPDSFFDVALGNVPFGDFKIPDKKYDKYNFLIHDYFFARTIDKVRPGGIVAFITSKGTLDKENPSVRKYIAQRCDLLGAIRLPNDTFKKNAGTEVTSDIIFLQKRDRMVDYEPDWVHLSTDENGIKMNQYFVDNPDMIMGEMQMISGPYGPTPACVADEGQDFSEMLHDAIQNIHGQISEYEIEDLDEDAVDDSIPADPDVKNFSFTVVDGKIYYRENSRMTPVDVSATAESRIKGLVKIRESVRNLIEIQTEDYPDEDIQKAQAELNELYDSFTKKYGIINSRANNTVFGSDNSYCLLCSLEVLDDDGNFVRKADMFSKRTIKQKVIVTSVDTASEALALSLAEKTRVDIEYMSNLTGKTEEELYSDLKGVIFLNPLHTYEGDGHEKYLPADEYLSGNVREKLALARKTAEIYPEDYAPNVKALEGVQPKDLTASEISVRLGATWLPKEIVEQFMFELFDTPRSCQWNIHVNFAKYTGEWNIDGKTYDRGNVKANSTYGTTRINGYKIIEQTLNLKDVRIFDYVEDENGNKKPVLNKKETAIAQGKQELIKEAFADWIWKDPERRDKLCKLYNEKFNSNRPREYDGDHLNFVGMNPEITLRKHQVDAIAHIIYGGNTLLAHEVGAGKTFEMVAAAQESKRLGLCNKSLFVVPNHLIGQWATEYLQLYPSANILVATKKDFETKNRKKFCARIATGDYDAIIIGHSQFEKIPMSIERQRYILEQQMHEVLDGIAELKAKRGDKFSVKQLEQTKKTISAKLAKLNDQSRKDDVVTFEELGVDRIFIDEAHYFKNLAVFTKMRNVGGISQTEAQKSSDLYMKCRYLDEITGGRGIVFATGTPISNSMVELYTMQKYLQYDTLRRNDLLHFDAWASTFGETVTAIELSPEGTGYRAKTRFAKFHNLPELMSMFKEVADIQTADMLKLPVPDAKFHNVVLKPSEHQKRFVDSLSERAERVRNKMVSSDVDNMLLITNDGRKLALDQRLINDTLPDYESGKVAACADEIYSIWDRTTPERSSQLVFCDLSTPHGDGKFNVYDDLRKKLTEKGIPEEEIAFIHEANSEVQKKELFGKVRNGQVRVLIGSTSKMGAGTNVQKHLCALHHLDTPWRPADFSQRNGRIIRQGNENPEVDIFTYVTENTFDSYLYQLVENKQKFIGQIMTSKSPVRSAEDVDEQALSYAEIKMLATGNPHIKEKMDLDVSVSKLKLLKANHLSQHYALEDKILKDYPAKIAVLEQRIVGFDEDIKCRDENTCPNEDGFSPMVIKGITYTDKKEAGTALIEACKAMTSPEPVEVGSYRGFRIELSFDSYSKEFNAALKNELRHTTPLGSDIFGNIIRLDNTLNAFAERQIACREQLDNTKVQLANAKVEVEAPFPHEEELTQKSARLAELNALLNLDKKDNEIVDGEVADEEPPERKSKDRGDAR